MSLQQTLRFSPGTVGGGLRGCSPVRPGSQGLSWRVPGGRPWSGCCHGIRISGRPPPPPADGSIRGLGKALKNDWLLVQEMSGHR